MNSIISAITAVIACSAVFGFIILCMRRRILAATDSICDSIDAIVDNKFQDYAYFCDDTLPAKVSQRLIKLWEVVQYRTSQASNERQEIQILVSDISHQVKTPVTNLCIYAKILEEREVDADQQKQFARTITEHAQHLQFLMDSLIKLSRLETGIIEIHGAENPLHATLEQAVRNVAREAEQKGIQITTDCSDGLMALHDPKWTSEAIYNLLDNAVKYTPENGSITLSVDPWELYTRIQVIDTGKGIAEKNRLKVFQRFFREPDVKGLPGIGLGLPIAKEIINRQNGYIKMEGALSGGAAFSVFLPNH